MDFSRRDFLKISGTTYLVITAGCKDKEAEIVREPALPKTETIDPSQLAYPPCEGYLLVDTKKCQGCLTCMLGCSLAHEGEENLSLSRIQIKQDPFERFPDDIILAQCRQCVDPLCVEACPAGALHVDKAHGNVRRVDQGRCIGCMDCLSACPFPSSRMVWNPETQLAYKCDLCVNTPHWKEKGGAAGKQLCVEACPVGAIKLVSYIPLQKGKAGYEINLRGLTWAKWKYPID